MLFNSFAFLLFFIVFFFLYWFLVNRNIKFQNLLLLFGSYVFYSFTDWRFLFFLIGVSALNYLLGVYIEQATKYKRLLMYIGLLQGIGGLAFFKYFNFFITSFNDAFHSLNVNLNLQTLNIIIPLGISFFTFRTISYVLDVYNENIKATKDWVVFFNYVSFFPALLSGPIDKAGLFIPQLERERVFDYNQASNGMRQILWGLFKKVVIADNCSIFVNEIFNNYTDYSGATLLLGAFFFTFQLYADFSGYSDMAIGFSRLLGFNITKNFDFPFFSQNIAEFWRKWHISLTSWLTEYVFTPLSFNFRNLGKLGLIFAIIINFTICGIWHGANWTYILFGFLHGCFFIPLILKGTLNKKKKIAKGKLCPSIREFINMLMTFTLVLLTFILFRSETIADALEYISGIFSNSLATIPQLISPKLNMIYTLFCLFIFITIEWLNREKDHGLEITHLKTKYRWIIYSLVALLIITFGAFSNNEFIYSQF